MNPSRRISVPELAKRLNCSIPHAQHLIRTQRIPGIKDTCGWVTTEAALEQYLKEKKAQSNGAARAA